RLRAATSTIGSNKHCHHTDDSIQSSEVSEQQYLDAGPALGLVVGHAVGLVGPAPEDAPPLRRVVERLGLVEVAVVVAAPVLVAGGVVRHVPVLAPVVAADGVV